MLHEYSGSSLTAVSMIMGTLGCREATGSSHLSQPCGDTGESSENGSVFSQRHHEQLSTGLGFRCETWSHQDLTISRVTPTIHTATSSSHGPLASYWPCRPQRPRNKAGTVRGPARAAPRGSVDADSRPRHAHPAARPRGCSS